MTQDARRSFAQATAQERYSVRPGDEFTTPTGRICRLLATPPDGERGVLHFEYLQRPSRDGTQRAPDGFALRRRNLRMLTKVGE